MSLSPLDREALARALDDSDPDREHFLHVEDGTIWTFVVSEATDESRSMYERVQEGAGPHWRRIPSKSLQETFEELEDFVDNLSDPSVRRSLFSTLEGKGAFRLFREFMLDHPAERALWEDFRAERSRRRVERFLQSLSATSGIAPPVSS
jgi:hypothetical protein